jgi:hypothetical protein
MVSQLLVKEAGWQLRPNNSPKVETIDSQKIQNYGSLNITINITDQQALQRTRQDVYIAMDIRNYDLILGAPWLQTQNPDID